MSDVPVNPQSQSPISKLLPWIVLLLSALGLFYFVQKGCGGSAATMEKTETPADTTHTN
jgi:hypothetical protein